MPRTETVTPASQAIETACPSGELQVDNRPLVDALERFSSDYRSWARLFQNNEAAPIELHPDFTVREASGAETACRRPAMLLRCLRDGDSTGYAALLPKDISSRLAGGMGPEWTLRGWRLAGNRLLASPETPVAQALFDGSLQALRERDADFLLIEELDEDSHLHRLVRASANDGFRIDTPTGFQERFWIRMSDEAGAYWSSFSSKSRNAFRRKIKKLGEAQLVRVTQLVQVPDFLDHAHRISQNSWQTRRLGLRVRNNEAELRSFTFLAEQNALRSYLLFCGQTPVAFLIGTQYGGTFRCEELGFDSGWADRSPGLVLLLKILDDLFEVRTPDWLDFGLGEARYKRQFGNHVSRCGSVWIVPPGVRQIATVGYLKTCRALASGVRAALTKTGLWTRVRRWLRHG